MLTAARHKIREWKDREDGLAATEFAMVFPLLFMMVVGVWDIGNGLMTNQKVIAAAQNVVDLIGRQEIVSDGELQQAFKAGQLALMPYETDGLVIDVVSVIYDEDDEPQVHWQETTGGISDPDLVTRTVGLGTEGGGALVVQVSYNYEPLFAGAVIGAIQMRERVFSRGRNSAVIERE